MLLCTKSIRGIALAFTTIIAVSVFTNLRAQAGAFVEEVLVSETKTHDDRAVITRQNGESYLIEKGNGCISLWRYEGRPVLIVSPGQFLTAGSRLLLSDPRQQCSIWMISRGRTWFGAPRIATESLWD